MKISIYQMRKWSQYTGLLKSFTQKETIKKGKGKEQTFFRQESNWNFLQQNQWTEQQRLFPGLLIYVFHNKSLIQNPLEPVEENPAWI